jgi:hypothetical protein
MIWKVVDQGCIIPLVNQIPTKVAGELSIEYTEQGISVISNYNLSEGQELHLNRSLITNRELLMTHGVADNSIKMADIFMTYVLADQDPLFESKMILCDANANSFIYQL